MKQILSAFQAITLVLFIGLVFSAFHLVQPENEQSSDFLILVQKANSGLILTCESGCSWEKLSLPLRNYEPQLVDQNGKASVHQDDVERHESKTDFLFSIQMTSNGIALQGIHGTKWKELTFSCATKDCSQLIDASGMAVQ